MVDNGIVFIILVALLIGFSVGVVVCGERQHAIAIKNGVGYYDSKDGTFKYGCVDCKAAMQKKKQEERK